MHALRLSLGTKGLYNKAPTMSFKLIVYFSIKTLKRFLFLFHIS